ncbi:MAG TPA: hypothetical protein VKH15_11735 [Candidatus Acidoferrum sp.]|nr:hypothetical protein [Candidatus Acidoferrum sp.]
MTAQDYIAPESVGRLQQRGLGAAIAGLVVCGICYFLYGDKYADQFFHSYLIAFMFVLGLSLGSLGLLMLQHLTSGHWGIMIRRPLESATRVLPVVAVFFLPLAIFGMKHLYGEWLNAPQSGEGQLSDLQKEYLTTNGFLIRSVIYFAVWLLLMFIFNRWSKEQDVNREDRALRLRLKMLAGPGIILYVFVMTFASIDWVMSLSPHWASTIYGFLFVIGQLISSMSLMIAVLVLLSRTSPMEGIVQSRHLHDLGKLLLAFVMLWAYFGFSQLLIIWSGNLPEEISFYRTRLYGGWGVVAVLVLIFHFFVPFFSLLSRDVKRSAKMLPRVALWLIFMRLVDLFWLTRPEFTSSAVPRLMDLGAILALAGIWLAVFAWNLKAQPLLPLGDPKLEEAIEVHEY